MQNPKVVPRPLRDTSVPPPGSLSAPVSRTVPTSLVAAAAAAAARARSVAMAFLPRFGSSSPLPFPRHGARPMPAVLSGPGSTKNISLSYNVHSLKPLL